MNQMREFWQSRLEEAWKKAPICWLAGVRRSGKTTLAKSLVGATYLNCDLAESADRLADPMRFFQSQNGRTVVLDEVHQLPDPSRLLKIAADEFPEVRVLATGSSTLAATEKFSDSLTGRKRLVHLVPVLPEELSGFGVPDLDRRMLRGGLPLPLLAEKHDPEYYAEWLDSYYARDIQELFRIGKRGAFLTLLEALLRQSGGICEPTALARVAGISRPTVLSYLDALEATHTMTLVRPWSGGRSDRELVQAAKCYGFDSGFVCHAKGIRDIRPDDRGLLFEHLALESLQAVSGAPRIHYWRTKERREEIDFVVPVGRECHAIEVKWSAGAFDPKNLRSFRADYPEGRNILVCAGAGGVGKRVFAGMSVDVVPVEHLRSHVQKLIGG